MQRIWKIFLRVIRSYSVEEKVVSIVVAGILVFVSAQSMLDWFRVPSAFSQGFTEGMISDRPVSLNPLYVNFNESARDISSLVFNGLNKYDPGQKSFVDDLANLTISADKMSYKFVLKPDLKWHDGQQVSADDVIFTFKDLIQNPAFQNPVIKANFEGVNIQKIDDKTVEFKLQKPNAFFITNMNVGILPKHLLAETSVEELPTSQFNAKPIGTGPYKVDGKLEIYDDGREHVNLRAFENYYGGMPRVAQLHFNIYPDEETLKKELGSINILTKVPASLSAELQKQNRFTIVNYELPSYTAVFFNMNNAILKLDKVRIGLMKAIDKEQLLAQFSDKLPVDTPLLDLNQQDWIYKPNLKEAQGAFHDAGFNLDPKQDHPVRVGKSGKQLKFVLLARAYAEGTSQADETQKTVAFLKNQWAQLGLDIDVQLVDGDTYFQRLQARDFDMALAGQSLGYNLDTYSYWHSSQATAQGLNLSNYRSFGADQLIEKIRATFDTAQKDKFLKQLAQTLAADVPAVFLYRPKYSFATDRKVQGVQLNNLAFPSDRFANIGAWATN